MNTVILSESQVDRLVQKLLNESGIRNINSLLKRYKKAKIYFHQDLDGVTTAIAMRDYLEDQGAEHNIWHMMK
jgi:single-stranded DNA-specific DHH superfamily exonuclease